MQDKFDFFQNVCRYKFKRLSRPRRGFICPRKNLDSHEVQRSGSRENSTAVDHVVSED